MSSELDLRGLHRAHDPKPEFVERLRLRLEAAATGAIDAGGRVDDVETALDPPLEAARTLRRRIAIPVAAAIVVLAAVSGVLWTQLDDSDRTIYVGDPEASTAPGPVKNGWVALDDGGDIYLVRPGEDARRLEVAGSVTADEACPTWSPDGARLSFGRVTGSSDTALSDAELVIVPVGLDGAIGAPTVVALDGFHALDGFDAHPCAIWAPDGRWVAFGGTGEVWVVDTDTGAIRRLPDLRPSDLEWRPGTDQLAIAGDMGTNRAADTLSTPVTVYSVSTGELRQLGSVRAAHFTWSPDGSTLAYQGGENDADGLWLVDADGTNERLLTHVGDAMHGIGPVWSPTGDRIAYQRICDTIAGSPGRACNEQHEVVLVSVADGNETVIEPPETDGPNGPMWWYPFIVTWSPDGTTLLYTAWGQAPGSPELRGVIAVPADTPTNVTVLTDAIGRGGYYSHRWVPIQMWGRQPG
jgi:Tol biopolymer transport system component